MAAIETVKLRDFVQSKQASGIKKNLPFVHTTETTRLISILNKRALLATECNIFKGEKLCYLFVARPSYKYECAGEAPYWMLPSVIITRFEHPPAFKRIYPFDSGAFSRRRLPDYITTFSREDFELGDDVNSANALIEAFFDTEKRYWRRQPMSEADFRAKHDLGPLHMQIEALNRLYGDRSNTFDDRAACIEAQVSSNIPLGSTDVLGVVVPDEMMRDSSIRKAIDEITSHVETYSIHPVNVEMYYGLIYEGVQRIYNKFGILR